MGWWSSSYAVSAILCLAVCFISIGFTAGVEDPARYYNCNRSSCGDIHIRYPFRLKEDPATCGDPNYELTCNSRENRTLLEFSSIQYAVKRIVYSEKYIQVVDVVLLSNNCSLPLKFLSSTVMKYYDDHYDDLRLPYIVWTYEWVSIMRCSKKLTSQRHQLFPCQSPKDSYLYGVVGNEVADLAPSCSFLSWMPTIYDYKDPNPKDLFLLIQDGFFLSWNKPQVFPDRPRATIRFCLRRSSGAFQDTFKASNVLTFIPAVFRAEKEFLYCMVTYMWDPVSSQIMDTAVSYPQSLLFIVPIVLVVINFVVACRFVFAPLSLCFFLAHKFWSTWALEDAVEKFLRTQPSLSPTRYAYTDIITITRNFREQLGRGGFGAVYRGELPGGHFIAVKMLAENSKFNGDDFINEVSTIGRIHHVNVVRLLGFCSDGSKRALIYEYMPMGSLEKYIFSADKTPNHYFSWKKLNSIALGVARGINYLHRGCDMTILHFDIKPQNILLDHRFRPKISDFGLAKLYPKDNDMVSVSVAKGTIGYIAPELVSRSFGLISHKSDVYSFGMLLLEMGAGRRNVDNNACHSSQAYNPSLIYDKLNKINININEMAEEGIGIEYSAEMNEVEKKLYIVGFRCIQIRPSDRPSMSDVVEMLEGDVDVLQLPPKPFFSSSPSISIMPHSEITATKEELPAIDEDDSSL